MNNMTIDMTERDRGLSRLVWLTLALFLSYLCVSMPLPVVSLYVCGQLGLNDGLSGLAVGIAFLSTILTRTFAGRLADRDSGRSAMLRGLLLYASANLVCAASTWALLPPGLNYSVLIAGRLLLGLGESFTLIGMISWAIGLLGHERSGRVMSLMGIGICGSFTVGGPLGLALYSELGFGGLMMVALLLPLIGLFMVRLLPGVAPSKGAREPFWHILSRIWRPRAVVFLQGVGFAALGAFVSLYFLAHGWPLAGLALSAFGAGFVLMRLLCGHLPDRIGGVRVAAASLAIEAAGQALLWQAGAPFIALLGAFCTGLGCSMIFPSMGVEVVRRVPPHLRGTAMGGFAAFQDLAYGATGPIAGLFAAGFGYDIVFLIGLFAAVLGLVMTVWIGRLPALDS